MESLGTLPTKVVCWGKGLCKERWGTVAPSLLETGGRRREVWGEMRQVGVSGLGVMCSAPVDLFLNACKEGGLGRVLEESAGFVDVSEGGVDIAWLRGEGVADGFTAGGGLNGGDDFVECNGASAGNVEGVEWGREVECGEKRGDGVGTVGIVPAGTAVAIDRDGLGVADGVDEFVEGKIGPLAGAVYGEETENDGLDVVEMGVGVAEMFASEFAGGVRRDGAGWSCVLEKRHGEAKAIDGAGGGEDKFADAGLAGGLEHGGRALDVDRGATERFQDGEANTGQSGEVKYGFSAVCAEGSSNGCCVADIGFEQRGAGFAGVPALDHRIVLGAEVID